MTGSDDGYLRLWPLDFKHVYLEAEHEGPVTAVNISTDGVKILAATALVSKAKKVSSINDICKHCFCDTKNVLIILILSNLNAVLHFAKKVLGH